MPLFSRGRYAARAAVTEADLFAARKLRALQFRGDATGIDSDDFDDACTHILVEDQRDGGLVCCYRMLPLRNGGEIARSYSAQFYELSALAEYPGAMVEMGRFCIHPDYRDPDILRTAWAAMVRYVDANDVEMLFGCSSFHGAEAESHMDAFALLNQKHLAPKRWLPRVKAPAVFNFARRLGARKPDLKAAMKGMPPLLRTYLLMGGWVSDHAVVDRDLDTMHVFTGLEIKGIPPARARLLRASAQ